MGTNQTNVACKYELIWRDWDRIQCRVFVWTLLLNVWLRKQQISDENLKENQHDGVSVTCHTRGTKSEFSFLEIFKDIVTFFSWGGGIPKVTQVQFSPIQILPFIMDFIFQPYILVPLWIIKWRSTSNINPFLEHKNPLRGLELYNGCLCKSTSPMYAA
jgi:hypothetical protein